MNVIVIKHVKLVDLPESWRAKLAARHDARVTVRIEEETESTDTQSVSAFAEDPLFGMWRDREDMADVASYIRHIRAPRFGLGSETADSEADPTDGH